MEGEEKGRAGGSGVGSGWFQGFVRRVGIGSGRTVAHTTTAVKTKRKKEKTIDYFSREKSPKTSLPTTSTLPNTS